MSVYLEKKKKPIGLWSAVSMGIGAMVGAGIFALLGEASSIAGAAVYISFIIGGVIALFSGYSFGKLGARYPSCGGIVEYLAQSFGTGLFTGSMSLLLYFTAIVSITLISKAFGNYAAVMFGFSDTGVFPEVFSILVVVLFALLNLKGAKEMAKIERITVGIKFVVLVLFAVVGLFFINPSLLSPSNYPALNNVFFSLSITFFAYEGFRVITNTAEDMENPQKTLPRAMIISILLVMLLYVLISISVLGILSIDDVVRVKDFALAEATLPVFGRFGFMVISFTALVATSSAINANLYAVTNVSYKLAKNGQLPSSFGKSIYGSSEGLIISSVLIIIFSLFFDLSEIASVGSIAILFIHMITHLGHLKLISETKASKVMIILAILFTFVPMSLSIYYIAMKSSFVLLFLFALVFISFIFEIVLSKFMGKKLDIRIKKHFWQF